MKKSSEKSNKIVVIGGSAGSVNPLRDFGEVFSRGFPYPIVIVIHRVKNQKSGYAKILERHYQMPVKEADDKEPLLPGTCYLAPQNYHLLVGDDFTTCLDYSEEVHYSRPSISVTFESFSEVYKSGMIAILLSGANADGAEELQLVKHFGGQVIIQDPEEAEMDMMPRAGLKEVPDALVLNTAQIIAFLEKERTTFDTQHSG